MPILVKGVVQGRFGGGQTTPPMALGGGSTTLNEQNWGGQNHP
jgi:hypothetical protein